MAKVKNFFKKVGLWFKNHAPSKRRLIQVYAALLYNANIKGFFGKGSDIIYRGGLKNVCAPGLNCYSCPGAVASSGISPVLRKYIHCSRGTFDHRSKSFTLSM